MGQKGKDEYLIMFSLPFSNLVSIWKNQWITNSVDIEFWWLRFHHVRVITGRTNELLGMIYKLKTIDRSPSAVYQQNTLYCYLELFSLIILHYLKCLKFLQGYTRSKYYGNHSSGNWYNISQIDNYGHQIIIPDNARNIFNIES